jgi:branched-chain amino acid transport system substrate-binding protein
MLFRTGSASAASEPIRIGLLTDIGGPYSYLTGVGSVTGAKLAIEDFSTQHPDIPVELLTADFQLKPDIAVSIAGDWLESKGFDMIIDIPLSSAAIAIGEICKAKDKLAIINGASSSAVTGANCGPNHIQWTYDTWSLAHTLVQATLKEGGDTWFFLGADYVFGHTMAADGSSFVTAGGGKLVGQVFYPFGTTDFSAFLLQAQSSGAKVIGFANAGQDTVNCLKQAREFGIPQSGVKLGALGLQIPDVVSTGLETAQGARWAEPYYWDLNDGTRTFGRRFAARMPNNEMPCSAQAGMYSAMQHYLKTVAAMGVKDAKASGRAVIAKMKQIPVNDVIFGGSTIRDDGRVMHPMYLFEAKKPAESKEIWDVGKVVGTVSASEASRPLNAGGCPMVKA